MAEQVFLKLGGSLITDKSRAHVVRPEVLARLADEIGASLERLPGLRLLVGHGSGSFGHMAASKYHTRAGVSGPESWRGFAEVWYEARALNQMVIEALSKAGIPVIAFPPSAILEAHDGRPGRIDTRALSAALQAGLVPVVYGDTIFDDARGGTILSTEDVFSALAPVLRPARILLAGMDPGVYADFPACQRLLERITPDTFGSVASGVSGSASPDVTGGMREKVELMLALVRRAPGLEALIFSGEKAGLVQGALLGAWPGTRITS